MKNDRIIILLLLLISKISFSQTDTSQLFIDDTAAVAASVEPDTASSSKPFGSFWSHDPHSVKQAALFSAVIPGLGQAYNEKYWKIPIVYAALGTAGFFVIGNSRAYHQLRDTYLLRTDGDSTTSDEYVNVFGVQEYTGALSDDYLLNYVDQWKRYTDINYIILSFIYLLNIVDAVVDAHLYSFDVSDDLSMQADPYLLPNYYFPTQHNSAFGGIGLNLKFTFK